MPHSIARIYIHLVFGTKLRLPLIQETVQKSLFAFMAGILNRMDCEPIRIGGVNDHVHLLFVLSRKYAVSKIAEEVKRHSSKWMKTQGDDFSGFQWQNGYAAFSVSQSILDRVIKYIENQAEHHRKRSFAQEYEAILKKHGLTLDLPHWNEDI